MSVSSQNTVPPTHVVLPRRAPRKGMRAPWKGVRAATGRTTPGGVVARDARSASYPPSPVLCGHPRRCGDLCQRDITTTGSCATEALPSARPSNEHGRTLELAYGRQPNTYVGTSLLDCCRRTSTLMLEVKDGLSFQTNKRDC
jgi:hypothetical protein